MDNNQEQFINSLLEKIKTDRIPEEELKTLKETLILQFQERLGVEMINMLSEEDQEKYFEMIEAKKSEEEIQEFLTTHIDNMEEKITDFLLRFEEDFLKE